MHSLHNLTMFYSYACQLLYTMLLNMYNKRDEACLAIKFHADVAPWWAQKQIPLPPFQTVIKRKIIVQNGIQREQTTPIYPLRSFALTWHADVGHIMHMVPCISYFIHKICHLLSLDMLCVNAICLVSISYL